MKYVLISGGVISGIGKGITASSIGKILQYAGFSVTSIKIDPYLNIDAGMMSPYEHGEVYVLNDGTETDLDLGNYERFLGIQLTKDHNITSGGVFWQVINDERQGKYLGKTVQTIPHVSDLIKDIIKKTSIINVGKGDPEICIIELGGTIGDIESLHFVESIRQLIFEEPNNWCSVHVSLLIENSGEYKTKPTQNTVKDLRNFGITPDFIVTRSNSPGPKEHEINKLSLMCQVSKENIIKAMDVSSIYMVPQYFSNQGFGEKIIKKLNLEQRNKIQDLKIILPKENEITIGIIGKYTRFADAYLSVLRAVEHASIRKNIKVNIKWIESDSENLFEQIDNCSGVIIPGGFGHRGVEQMIKAAEYTFKHDIPTLGICLGFQVMALTLARQYCKNINSEEFNKEGIQLFKRGNMKLGTYKPTSSDFIGYPFCNYTPQRYRHRYHLTQNSNILEYLRFENTKKFWLGVQFHPEFNSSWEHPSEIFMKFMGIFKKGI